MAIEENGRGHFASSILEDLLVALCGIHWGCLVLHHSGHDLVHPGSFTGVHVRALFAAGFLRGTIGYLLTAGQRGTRGLPATDLQGHDVTRANGTGVESIGRQVRVPRVSNGIEVLAQGAATTRAIGGLQFLVCLGI